MSNKISKIKLVKVNGLPVIAPRAYSTDQIKNWFEDDVEMLAAEILPLGLSARPEQGEPTYAEQIEKRDFEPEDLPMFL